MPIELQIIRARDFIRLGAQGAFDFAASKLALAELAHACQKRGIHQAVLDLRALKPGPVPVFSPSDLAALVYTFHEIGFSKKHRLAVLYAADPHHRAHLFAFIGRMRGWSVAAFESFEEALSWLSDGRTDEPDIHAAMVPRVSIQVHERRTKARKGSKSPIGRR
jgi:hypothetical protein